MTAGYSWIEERCEVCDTIQPHPVAVSEFVTTQKQQNWLRSLVFGGIAEIHVGSIDSARYQNQGLMVTPCRT